MSTQGNNDRGARQVRTKHLYAVGDAVRLRDGYMRPFGAGDSYHIVRSLPPIGGVPQYRLRSDGENHERVITQDFIEPAIGLSSGQGTEPNPAA